MKSYLLSLLLLLPGPVAAHHGLAAFDTSAPVTFHGTVTDFHFVNPHCVVEFDVKDDQGQVRNWKAELTSANHLAPKGWTESSIQAGDQITITGFRAKNGAASLWATKVVLANGEELKINGGN